MPRKPKSFTSEAPLAPIPAAILDQFVGQGPLTPEELDAVVRRFKKAIIERALGRRDDPAVGGNPRTRPIIATGRAAKRR
jgi:hypothetical protein